MKKLYKLRPKVGLQKDFFVFDTETGIKKSDKIKYMLEARPDKFIFGVVYGHNYTRVIYSVQEFIEEFKHSRYKNKKVFAHNAEYDLTVLYGNIFHMDSRAIFNGKFIRATNGNCIFADSMNIYRYSVKRIGEYLGMEKLKLGNELVSNTEGGNISKKDINYCIRDCRIVYEALYQIFNDTNDIKITQASLSLAYYRRFHQPYHIEHNNKTSYFYNSYYGGRTEVFKLGNTYSSVFDINSSYPYAMRECVFPNPKYIKHHSKISNKIFNRFLWDHEGSALATVKHKESWIGYLPHKLDGKLCFPVGQFTGWWNFNELRFALESDAIYIIEIHEFVYSNPIDSPFKKYVNDLYKQRFSSNNPMEIERVKIYMNSLYGKFAQKIDRETIYIKDISDSWDFIEYHQAKGTFIELQLFNQERQDAFLIVKSEKNFSLNFSIPSFSSYITSFARIHLLKKLLSSEKNRPVYCDTDSIFLEIDPLWKNDHEMGGWKREDKIITRIDGLKNYKYIKGGKELFKIKGIPRSAKFEKGSYYYQNLIKTKEALRRNLTPGILTNRIKKLNNNYSKRIVLKNGETNPIKL